MVLTPQAAPAPLIPPAPGQFWTWRGYRIYYVQAGSHNSQLGSHPPLLLVHGFGASTDHWQKSIAGLQDSYEVWAIDLLGFGRSDKAKANYSGKFWSEQIADFVTQVIGRPAVLVGNSIGGYATLCAAAYRPDVAAGLILLNCAGPFTGDRPSELPKNPLKRVAYHVRQDLFQQSWIHWLVFLNMRRRSAIRKTLGKVYFNADAITPQLVEEIYRPALDKGSFQAFSAMFSSAPGEPIDQLLQQLKCPLLMLWGAKDPWGRVESRAPKFRQYYPQLQEYFLEAGHCPHDEVPELVNQYIADWMLQL